VPAERPHNGPRPWQSWTPKTARDGDYANVDVPRVPRVTGIDGALGSAGLLGLRRPATARACRSTPRRIWSRRPLAQHPAHCRGTEVQSASREELRGLDLAERGKQTAKLLHEIRHEFRKAIDCHRYSHKRVLALFVESLEPRGHRGRREQEAPRGLGSAPAGRRLVSWRTRSRSGGEKCGRLFAGTLSKRLRSKLSSSACCATSVCKRSHSARRRTRSRGLLMAQPRTWVTTARARPTAPSSAEATCFGQFFGKGIELGFIAIRLSGPELRLDQTSWTIS
jgi:hypothetical protein